MADCINVKDLETIFNSYKPHCTTIYGMSVSAWNEFMYCPEDHLVHFFEYKFDKMDRETQIPQIPQIESNMKKRERQSTDIDDDKSTKSNVKQNGPQVDVQFKHIASPLAQRFKVINPPIIDKNKSKSKSKSKSKKPQPFVFSHKFSRYANTSKCIHCPNHMPLRRFIGSKVGNMLINQSIIENPDIQISNTNKACSFVIHHEDCKLFTPNKTEVKSTITTITFHLSSAKYEKFKKFQNIV